jgi:hypothetical protein
MLNQGYQPFGSLAVVGTLLNCEYIQVFVKFEEKL